MRWMPILLLLAAACESKPTEPPAADTAHTATAPAAQASAAPEKPEEGLKKGDPAPDVEMALHSGEKVKLSSLKGSKVLIWFYPKDDTPGCTAEGQGLRDNYDALTEAGVKIYGVSLQDADSHQAFIDKHEFQFPLVVDDGTLARAFGVPIKGEVTARQSFLVGEDGKLIEVWRKVTPGEHAEQVLAAIPSRD